MSQKKHIHIGGKSIGFPGVLAIVFIVLKLTGEIDWSWWWVLAPIWISAIGGVAFLAIVLWAHHSNS